MTERWQWTWRRTVCLIALACLLPAARAQDKQPGGEPDEKVYDLSPEMVPPRVTKQVSPQYKTARGVRLAGSVTVVLVVSSQGIPRDVRVVKGLDKDVDQSAIEAVLQWEFAPARKDDKPVAVRISLEIEFHSM
jgi:TonB family protein